MANLNIARPQAAQKVALESLESARIVLAFPPADATLERVGDDLVFKFEDGGEVALTGFYKTYTSENMPTFEIGGAEVSGKDFFVALGEDLMPAAGPAAAAAAPSGGRYNEFGNDALMGGVDRLGGLDIGFNNGVQPEDTNLGGIGNVGGTDTGLLGALGGTAADPVAPPVGPSDPTGPTDPSEPEKPVDPPLPPINPGDLANLNLGSVYEGALGSGTGKHPDFAGGLTSDQTSTSLNGLPPGWTVVGGGNAHGNLVQDANGNWSYQLTGPTQEHSDATDYDSASGKVDMVLRDPYGREVTVEVDVTIVDDAPLDASSDTKAKEQEDGSYMADGKIDLTFGADDMHPDDAISLDGWSGTKNNDGSWTFTKPDGSELILTPPAGGGTEWSYTITSPTKPEGDITGNITDKDGDKADISIDIKIDGIVRIDKNHSDTDLNTSDKEMGAHGTDSDTGNLSFTAPDGLASITIAGKELTWNGSNWLDSDNNVVTTIEGATGSLALGGLVTNADGTYTVGYEYTQDKAFTHDDATDPNEKDLGDSFNVVIKDANGDTAETDIKVTIEDDGPSDSSANTTAKEQEDGSYTADGKINLNFGADGMGDKAISLDGWDGSKTGDTWTFTKDGATLTLTPPAGGGTEWGYTITSPTKPEGDITGKLTDADGDKADIDITIETDNLVHIDKGQSTTDLETSDKEVGAQGQDSATGNLNFTAPDGLASITIAGKELTWNGSNWLDSDNNVVTSIEGTAGSLTLGGLTGSPESGYNVEYTYTQDKGFTGHDDVNDPNEKDVGEKFDVVIKDTSGDKGNASITVTIEDDGPSLEVTQGETQLGTSNNLKPVDDLNFHDFASGNLAGLAEAPSYTFAGGSVTVSAGYVDYDKAGSGGKITGGKFGTESGKTLNKSFEEDAGDARHGLSVGSNSGYWKDNEINMESGTRTEAVEFKLDGLAYGVNLSLSCFFSTGATDPSAEIARLSFYRGNELIYSVDISSDKIDGIFVAGEFKEFFRDGFDRLVISPVDNGNGFNNNSDFSIRDIGFDTIPEPLFITNGTVKGESGGDGFHTGNAADSTNYTTATLNYKDGQKLDLVDADGNTFSVNLSVERGTSGGDGTVTATDADGNLIFKAVLDKNGNWSFNQYKIFTSADGGTDGNDDTFDLSFITKDKDGDTVVKDVNIDTTPDAFNPAVKGLDVDGGEVRVSEEALGTDDATSAEKTFNISAPGGIKSATIDGTEIQVGAEIDGEYGKLTITGFKDLGNGNYEVSYKYTLAENAQHTPGEGHNTTLKGAEESFTVKVEGKASGEVAEGKLDVTIVDDVPEIQNLSGGEFGCQSGSNSASGIIQVDFGADDAAGKSITVGDITATWDGSKWNSDSGTFLVTDSGSLEFGDVTLTPGAGDNGNWLCTINNVPKGDAGKEVNIAIKDSDGDVSDITVTGKHNPSTPGGGEDNVVVPPLGMEWVDGTNYNVSIVLDNSGSMGTGTGYLDQAKLALCKLAVEQLNTHDGIINLQLVTFNNFANEKTYTFSGNDDLQILDTPFDAHGNPVPAVAIFTHNGKEVTVSKSGRADDNTLYDNNSNGWYQYVSDDQGNHWLEHTNGFEWTKVPGTENIKWASGDFIKDVLNISAGGQTNYGSALDMATNWFNKGDNVTPDSYTDKVFFITDGEPNRTIKDAVGVAIDGRTVNIAIPDGKIPGDAWTQEVGNVTYDVRMGWDQLGLKWIVQAKPQGSDVWYTGSDIQSSKNDVDSATLAAQEAIAGLKEALGLPDSGLTGAAIYVTGIGKPGDPEGDLLLKTLTELKLGDAQVTEDLNAALQGGHANTPTALQSNIVYAAGGQDVVFGDMAYATLQGIIATAINIKLEDGTLYQPSATEVVKYLQLHPELGDVDGKNIINGVPHADDNDILMGGSGHDMLYGQGGNDMLLGDGSETTLANMAKHLGVEGNYNFDHLGKLTDATEIGKLVDALGDKVRSLDDDQLQSFADWLEDKSGGIEASTDGNDKLFGGTGDDVLFGGGGNDMLFGGSGDDILFGGSGNDYIDGGAGADKIFGGSGNDLIKFDAADLLIDGGDDMDVLLGGTGDLADMKGMLVNGKIENVELLVTGDKVAGLTDMDQLYDKLGITKNDDGTLNLGQGWNENAAGGVEITGSEGYLEFTNHDGITILVQESLLKTDTGGGA